MAIEKSCNYVSNYLIINHIGLTVIIKLVAAVSHPHFSFF